MRTSQPRIEPLSSDQWSEEAAEVMAPFVAIGRDINIFRTLANHPGLMRRWLVFGNHVLGKSTLSDRDRELVILRTGVLCRAVYEWGQHVPIARDAGLTDDEIRRIRTGPDAAEWSERDRLLLAAADELHDDAFVSDETWAALAAHLTTEQLIDLVFAVGQYTLVSMALNSFGVEPDEGSPGWDV